MEQIIKKANEGGWNSTPYQVIQNPLLATLDPLFWHGLSNACGWKGLEIPTCPVCLNIYSCTKWGHSALAFHEINLVRGMDAAVKYLEDLIEK